jgi:hypothetical protein
MSRKTPAEAAMDKLLRFEHRRQPVASRRTFFRRIGRNLVVAMVAIGVSLIVGMIGYYVLEPSEPQNSLVAAFARAAMILSGMGPYSEPQSDGVKLLDGVHALYSGLLLIGTSGLILAPIFHRVLHSFHVEDADDDTQPKDRRK